MAPVQSMLLGPTELPNSLIRVCKNCADPGIVLLSAWAPSTIMKMYVCPPCTLILYALGLQRATIRCEAPPSTPASLVRF